MGRNRCHNFLGYDMNLNPKTNIEKLLPVDEINKEHYEAFVEEGKRKLKDKTVVFSMLCRNNGSVLNKNINILINLVKDYVKDYRFVVFENDSTDNTKQILSDLSASNDKFYYKSEDNNRQQYGPTKHKERTEALAEYRNRNLEYIKENYSDFDHVIVCDSDFIDISKNGFYNSFGMLYNSEIDAICGNSFQLMNIEGKLKLWNYDSWAYRGTWWYDWCYFQNKYVIDNPMLWFGYWILPVGTNPIIVNSAFGGLGIYKTKDYIEGTYSGIDCEHVTFHLSLRKKNPYFRLALNPSQVMLMPGP